MCTLFASIILLILAYTVMQVLFAGRDTTSSYKVWKESLSFLADRTNGRAYATVLRLSVRLSVCLSVCDVMYYIFIFYSPKMVENKTKQT